MRGATEPGIMPGDGSWHESLEGQVCFGSDLGLVATFEKNVGMRAWRVEFALSVTLV